jgi:hypothetical protein
MSNTEIASQPGFARRHWKMLTVFGVLSLLAIIVLHTAGFILALICWFWTGVIILGVKIYTGGHRKIARIQAEEADRYRQEKGLQ